MVIKDGFTWQDVVVTPTDIAKEKDVDAIESVKSVFNLNADVRLVVVSGLIIIHLKNYICPH